MFCLYIILNASQHTQFTLYGHLMLMSIFHHFTGECDVLLVREM
jgi:hypothetical protein